MDSLTRKENNPGQMKHSVISLDSPKTSLLFAAQSRSYDCKSNVRLKKIVNPFIPKVQNLEKDTCSPGVFVVGRSPSQNDEFSWSIDEISKIQPASIDSPKYISEEYDEQTETQAQEAIEKYFAQTHSIVSPINSCIGIWPSPVESTPKELSSRSCSATHRSTPAVSSTPCAKAADRRTIIKADAAVQTSLSLPTVLPPEVENILKPYFIYNQDNIQTEDVSMNNSTLRRKLFFNKEDELISPVKCPYFNSPPLDFTDKQGRICWSFGKDTPHQDQKNNLSSPDLSPIKSKTDSSPSLDETSFPNVQANRNIETWMDSSPGQMKHDSAVEAMAISLEVADEAPSIFSSTKNQPCKLDYSSSAIQGHFEIQQQDTGYQTISDEMTMKKYKFFNSTSLCPES